MATTVNISSNFVGQEAGEYIGQAIKMANTVSGGLVTILPNLVSPAFVRKIESANGFVDYVCGWTPDGSHTISERELAPKKIKWDNELCKEDFRQLWTSAQMGFSAHNDSLPDDENQAILMQMGKDIARHVDRTIWQGDSANAGEWDGFIKLMTADGDVIDVAAPAAGGVTPDNVEDELGKLIDATPDQVIQDADNHVFLVATNVIRALRRKYGSLARGNGIFLQPDEFSFEGYTITEGKGLASSYMVSYNRANMFFGTGLLADHNEIRVKDMDESDLSGIVRQKVVLTGGVQYAFSDEIVLYTPA